MKVEVALNVLYHHFIYIIVATEDVEILVAVNGDRGDKVKFANRLSVHDDLRNGLEMCGALAVGIHGLPDSTGRIPFNFYFITRIPKEYM